MSRDKSFERNIPSNRPIPKLTFDKIKKKSINNKCMSLVKQRIKMYYNKNKSKKFFDKKMISKLSEFCDKTNKKKYNKIIKNYINKIYK